MHALFKQKVKFLSTVLISLLLSFSCQKHILAVDDTNDEKLKDSVLLVLAHPDDETMIGGIILELKRLGVPVYAVYITSGEGGKKQVFENNQWESKKINSEKLRRIREGELEQVIQGYGFKGYLLLHQPDTPLRDQNGKPIRKGRYFLNKNIWSKVEIKNKIKEFVKNKNIKWLVSMSLDPETHAHHKSARLITEEIYHEKLITDLKGVLAFKESWWVKDSEQDETLFPYILFDRKTIYPGRNETYARLSDDVAQGHKSQQSGHTGPLIHKEKIYSVLGDFNSFYNLICKSNVACTLIIKN